MTKKQKAKKLLKRVKWLEAMVARLLNGKQVSKLKQAFE